MFIKILDEFYWRHKQIVLEYRPEDYKKYCIRIAGNGNYFDDLEQVQAYVEQRKIKKQGVLYDCRTLGV